MGPAVCHAGVLGGVGTGDERSPDFNDDRLVSETGSVVAGSDAIMDVLCLELFTTVCFVHHLQFTILHQQSPLPLI